MIAEGKVGLVTAADGAVSTARIDRTGAVVNAQAHGAYTESAVRGAIMEVSTGVAGVAPGTALSTTPPMALWNPPSSGKNISILKVSMGYVSGTLGGGTVLYAVVPAQNTVPTTGAELTPQCSMIGMPRGVARAFQGSTLAATPTILRPAWVIGAWVGTTASMPQDCVDIVDGSIIVPPGAAFVVQALAGAGTTPLALFSIAYEEIAI